MWQSFLKIFPVTFYSTVNPRIIYVYEHNLLPLCDFILSRLFLSNFIIL